MQLASLAKASPAKPSKTTTPSRARAPPISPQAQTNASEAKGDTGAANKKQKKAEARSVASFKLVLVYDAYVSRSGN